MFLIEERPASRSVWAGIPVTMPLHVLLALDPSATQVAARPGYLAFNLPGALSKLLGRFGRERAEKILAVKVWAPAWSDAELLEFVKGPVGGAVPPTAHLPTQVDAFPGVGVLTHPNTANYPVYEIVHLVGGPTSLDYAAEPAPAPASPTSVGWPRETVLYVNPPDEILHVGAFRDALIAARTRLLICQNAGLGPGDGHWESKARLLAEDLVASGGPAVLLLGATDPQAMNEYLERLYGDIVHNAPLSQMLQPGPALTARIRATLYRAYPGDDLLRFDHYMATLATRLDDMQADIVNVAAADPTRPGRLDALRATARARLHRKQADELAERFEAASTLDTEIANTVRRLQDVKAMSWSHESEGAVPLSETVEMIDALDRKRRDHATMEEDAQALTARAARVLNANFAEGERVLQSTDVLVAGREYAILVDVGPRWSTIPSVVSGHIYFPDASLPPDQEGYEIEVALVSDDFTPNLVRAWFWVPRGIGRSSPIVDGTKRDEAGPVALNIRAPQVSENGGVARGRLSLYYRNNVIQSARVTAQVARTSNVVSATPNAIDVDYVLSGTFHDAATLLRGRTVRFTESEERAERPVGVSVTVNADGANGHRIIVKTDAAGAPAVAAPAPGWTRYNPTGTGELLARARQGLLDCFWARDGAGEPQENVIGLDAANGKTYDGFRYDLRALAVLGSELFKVVTGELLAEDGAKPRVWVGTLRQAIRQSTVIQVARTVSAAYAFPWALLYEHPMPGPKFAFCKVVEEWKPSGRRTGTLRTQCPYADEAWHRENIYCPYGFWGLKHIVEQPPSALQRLRDGTWVVRDTTKIITATAPFDVAMAVTGDTRLDQKRLKTHITQLGQKLPPARFAPPTPVGTRTLVRAMLATPPAIAYFLCHGERDTQPFLGIGARDQDPEHRIYPDTVQDWASTPVPPNLATWATGHPLIFLNGCHTSDLNPNEVMNFVTAFTHADAAGILGTEVSVILPVATEVAESILGKVVGGTPVGEALHQTRWELLNKGNLLGLAYTLYALADLRVVGRG